MRLSCTSVTNVKLRRASFATRFSSALMMVGLVAAVGWPAESHAEPSADPLTEFAESLCPKLVKPGAELASTVSELQGNSGLTPELTGMVTGLAIQLQCPTLMASIARGELPELLLKQAENDSPALPFPLPGGKH